MKKILKIFLLTTLSAGILNCADAQRTRQFRGERTTRVSAGNSRNSSAPTRPVATRSTPVRTFSNNNRTSTPRINQNIARNVPSGNQVASVPRRNTTVTNSSQRTIVSRNGYNRQSGIMRNDYHNNYRYNNYHYNDYHNHYYGNVYGRRTGFMYGPRYTVIPHSFISIHFGGHPYYYNRGYFYGYYSGYYQPIFPPFGLHISVLPFGYSQIFIGAIPFYYYNGIYYRQYNNTYEVVDAPMGATVSSLPKGAKSVVINGERLYELNGTYYKADRDANGNDIFIVMGKNGVINNTSDDLSDITTSPSSLQIGDIVNQLPEGSKIVTLNGEQVYETPDDIYLQQESNNGVVEYKVVGR